MEMKTTRNQPVSTRKRIFDVIQIAGGSDTISKTFDRCIILLIILSIIIVTAQTFPLPDSVNKFLFFLDAVCMIAFTIEYALRLWTADYLYPDSRFPHLRYVVSISAIIDLFSFLPFYLSGLIPAGMVVFRLIRVARLLKLFQVNKYLDPVAAILTVLKEKASLLFGSLFLVFVLMFASSLLMYYAEHEAQPEVFENAFSGLWWAVSTLSTTGYGDIYPITMLGKALAILITLLGMCIVAVPTGIITAGFTETARRAAPRGSSDDSSSFSRIILDISGPDTIALSPALYDQEGSTIEQLHLSGFIGHCIVETVNGQLTGEKLGAIISRSSPKASHKILLRGQTELTEECVNFLAGLGTELIGSQAGSLTDENILRLLLANRIQVINNLDLQSIDDGEYLLNAAPVLASNCTKAPCRAYLMPVR